MPSFRYWLLFGLLLGPGCSVRQYAIDQLAEALSGTGKTFASDDDPELIRDAIPFSLKLVESVLTEAPRHRGLLLSAASGFTQYAYAFLSEDADEVEEKDLARALELRTRARRLYLRARDYGLRGLDAAHEGFATRIREKPREAAEEAAPEDVPFLYWTAAAWASAIALSKHDPELIAQVPCAEALIDRALELDEGYGDGAIHGFLISYEPSRQGAAGDAASRSKRHFDRVLELSGGGLASSYVAFAEAVCVAKQDKAGFESLLRRALEINPDARPEWRLANLIGQQRARWLLAREETLFLE